MILPPTPATPGGPGAPDGQGPLFVAPPLVRSWYLLGPASEVPAGRVISRELLGQPVVIFRGRSGPAHTLAAHCWHMGAHLGAGRVVGDRLRCPLHHWEYDGGGICRHVPGTAGAPAAARQPAYPTAEHLGGLFVFNAPAPSFPLPSFQHLALPRLRVSLGRPVRVRCPWYAVAANAFDKQHLETVHRRAVREAPTVTRPDPYRIQLRYVSRVVGRSPADETMRRLSGDRIAVTVTCWGGTVVTVESDLGRVRGALLIGLLPIASPDSPGSPATVGAHGGAAETEIRPIFTAPRTHLPALDAVRLAVSRWLFSKFLERDIGILEGMRFRPRLPLPADEPMGAYLDFLRDLPPAGQAPALPNGTAHEAGPSLRSG
ncbi:MAG TPA: Rieske 2Fe-2S domain-containing protein [Chloroflexota bacterium]|nr:Rieske 2Fe-2S domain-containing protein [Chloroflexota bacterium]